MNRPPRVLNTDQGSQFTSLELTAVLKDAGVATVMDGRGWCMDDIFIERLWRSLNSHSWLAVWRIVRLLPGWNEPMRADPAACYRTPAAVSSSMTRVTDFARRSTRVPVNRSGSTPVSRFFQDEPR